MCTCITRKVKDNYFGRTLDVEIDYKTSVVITPENYNFRWFENDFAIIGMAMVMNDYPLYFEGANEYGLAMAGLNFPSNAHYFERQNGKLNLAPFELIPYVLGKCKTTAEAEREFKQINITNENFNSVPSSPLHWIISDSERSITVEQTISGLKIYNNPVGVLTNNPEFSWHMTNLVNYMNVTVDEATNRMLDGIELKPFCKGLGGVGLPGDLSSPSRFIRATFSNNRAEKYDNEEKNVSQFFHILSDVSQTTGLSKAGDSFEQTLYTSCINTTKGIYYFTTYFNSRINSVKMNAENKTGKKLTVYPVNYDADIKYMG